MWLLSAVLAAAGALAAGAVTAPAAAADGTEVVKYAATDDAYVSSARPTYRFGANPSLIAGAAKADRMITYVKFTVGPVSADQRVAKADLRIMRETRAWPAIVKLKRVASASWSERSVTWRNRPGVGEDVATVRPSAGASEIRFDVSTVVTGAGTYTFAVTSPVSDGIARFRSSEYGWQGPKLFLTLAPAPVVPSPPPASEPQRPAPADPAECSVDAKLVPTCGLLWGAAAGGFSETPRDEALRTWEGKAGRPSTVYHTYHRGDELFPTKAEMAMARDPQSPRILMLNWKVAYGTKWANVAAGQQDARIDRLAAYITANFREKFFMVLHHEPENDVNPTAGSGMTATDYAAMFRHTVKRLKAKGVDNAIFVMAYMNYEKWNNSSWWYDLYPGDDVVDWIGLDSYVNAEPGGFHHGDFAYLMDRTNNPAAFPGWYTWATTAHPGKPLILAEWGVYGTSAHEASKANLFDTVLPQLPRFPALKGLVYFDTAADQSGKDMRIDSSAESLAAFRRIAADPRFTVKIG